MNKIDNILNKLEEKHDIIINRTPEIEKLINYVSKISYTQGYSAGKKKGISQSEYSEETNKPSPDGNISKENNVKEKINRCQQIKHAEEILGEKVLFISTYKDSEGNPIHGDIRRYRDGIRVGKFNNVDIHDNFVIVDEKHIKI